MKVYIKEHTFGAGQWIYKGYKDAWNSLGYDSFFYTNLNEIDKNQEYDLMAVDADINEHNFDVIKNARRSYVYTQPNKFPPPWGRHPNFVSLCPDPIIEKLNNLENAYQWCFGRVTDFHFKWKNVNYIPLAFDSNNYKPIKDDKYKFDICFVGGWANNGFNEKRKIMLNHFDQFKDCDIKCGIFINRDITHENEIKILYNSKIAINIHDAYQRKLGLDTNERTFKSLGLTGFMVSDEVKEVKNLFDNVPATSDPAEMKRLVLNFLEMNSDDLKQKKQENRLYIKNNHTYINRVEKLLGL